MLAEAPHLLVEQASRVSAQSGYALTTRPRVLKLPGLGKVGLVFLEQKQQPIVIGAQHVDRVTHRHDETGLGLDRDDALDDIGLVEIGH